MRKSDFSRTVEDSRGFLRLVYRRKARSEKGPDSRSALLDEYSFDELFKLLGLDEATRLAFADRDEIGIFSNGWQSWSAGFELFGKERIPVAKIIPKLNLYNFRDRQARGGPEIRSHFLTWLRLGNLYMGMISLGSSTPPLSFSIHRGKGRIRTEAYSDGKLWVEGETGGEVCLIYREGYFAFKDAVRELFASAERFKKLAFLCEANSPRPLPGGYESWYNHYNNINEELMLADLGAMRTNANLIRELYLERKRPAVFQVDDGWQAAVGEWEANPARFPNGMKGLADSIRAEGFIPGLWLAPFCVSSKARLFKEKRNWLLHDGKGNLRVAGWNSGFDGDFFVLDLSLPEVREHLHALFDRIVNEWGYRYLKLDFLYAGALSGDHWGGRAAYEWYLKSIHEISSITHNSAGEELGYLGCGAPLEMSYKAFPLMRIGADTKGAWEDLRLKAIGHIGRPSAYINLKDTIGRAFMDRTIFLNDPDVVFIRCKNIELTEKEKELIALVNFMLASQIMFSDDPKEFDPGDEATLTKRIIGLYDKLEGKEYGAERIGLDAFSVFSRDGKLIGLINLGDKPFLSEPGSEYDIDTALVAHCARSGEGCLFEPRSISLFLKD